MGNGSDDGSTTMSDLRKAELELMAMTMKFVIEPILEPLIRRVEEIALMQQVILTSLKQITGNEIQHRSEPRNLELRFRNKLPRQLWTGNHIKGEDGVSSVEIALVDVVTDNVVNFEHEVEIVLLRVDDEGHDWTTEEFNGKIVREWKGKPLLKGNTSLKLKAGMGLIDGISISHSKNPMPITKFRLGAKTKDNLNGMRVREAKSEIFFLKDSRNKRNKKHYRPSLDDEVWRLKKIGKDGDFHKRLCREKVDKVKDFLKLHFTDPTRLRNILGIGISDKVLNTIVEHSLTCKLDKKYISYPLASQPIIGVVFNEVRQAVGILIERQFVPTERLSEKEKDDAQKLVVSAFENCMDVFPYDESYFSAYSSHLINTVALPSISPRLESPINGPNVGNDHSQSVPSLLGIIPIDNLTGTSNDVIAGYDNLQPSTSSQGIIPPNDFPLGRTWSMDVVPYDESYLSPDSSHLVNAVALPSISPRRESPINGPNVGNDHSQSVPSLLGIILTDNLTGTTNAVIAGYDNLQPSTSSQGIIPPNDFPLWRAESMDEFRLWLHTLEEGCQLSVDDYNFQAVNHSEESPAANSHTAEIRVDAQAVAIDQTKGRRRLKWSLERTFSQTLRMRIEDSDHVQKKQRLH